LRGQPRFFIGIFKRHCTVGKVLFKYCKNAAFLKVHFTG